MTFRYIPAGPTPSRDPGVIHLYDAAAFEAMHAVGQVTAQCLDALVDLIGPGISTEEINSFVEYFAREHQVIPATIYYRGYTKACCTSVNHVICHGIPGPKILQKGDIINVDVTFVQDGWHGDASRMYIAGSPKRAAEHLVDVTYEALRRGIAAVRPGATTGDIGAQIQNYVESERCSVVRDFCGHGIGRLFHAMPNILHYGCPGEGTHLVPGMIFTIEPMVNWGRPEAKILSDGWTAVTRDRSLSAQFEHTVGVTETGVVVFTQSPKGRDHPFSVQRQKALSG